RTEALASLARELLDSGYRFTTVSPATHQRVLNRPDDHWAADLRDIFGWSKPFQLSVVPEALFRLMQAAGIIEPYREGLLSKVRFSTLNDLIFVHSAYPTQAADAVFFGP